MNRNGDHQLDTVDAAIVGGGLAGLTAATYLARDGRPGGRPQSIVVLEKARRAGGRAVTREQEEYHFNLGAHALYLKGQAHQVLKELDVPFTGKPPALGIPRSVVGGEALSLPRIFLTSRVLSVREKMNLMTTFIRLLRTPPVAVEELTVQEWLEKHSDSTAVHQVILSLFRVASYSHAPEQLSAAVLMRQLQLTVNGNALYLDGGWQTLVDGLRTAAEDAGAQIIAGARVATVERRGDASLLILDDGRRLLAGSVILAVGPRAVANLLPENDAVRRWASSATSVQVAALDVGLRRLPRPKVTFAQGIDRPLYYSVHSAAADLAPDGGALVHTLKYLHPDGADDADSAEAELEALLDLMQPGWRDEVVVRRFMPRMTVVRRMATAGEGLSGRPGPEVPGRDGIYVAGDWVGPEGWLADAAVASAKAAARLVLRRPKPSLQSEALEPV